MPKAIIEEEQTAEIQIVPFVDVVLVLLIIFMASAPIIHQRAVNVNVPAMAHSERKAMETLKISLNEKREVFLGQEKISTQELKEQLSMMVRADPLLHIAILADQEIPYKEVIGVLDIVRGAGAKKVALEVKAKRVE